uniref:Uncharacterized protein n=1 Tax=Anguilla anguilla TaxID=7936 RepID=A0A0E9V333_ANGAN
MGLMWVLFYSSASLQLYSSPTKMVEAKSVLS